MLVVDWRSERIGGHFGIHGCLDGVADGFDGFRPLRFLSHALIAVHNEDCVLYTILRQCMRSALFVGREKDRHR